MNDEEIIKLVNSSLVEEFELEVNDMKPEAHLIDDFELDSLDFVDMVIVLQKAFKFKLRDESAIREIRTLGDIHTLVINKKNEVENSESDKVEGAEQTTK